MPAVQNTHRFAGIANENEFYGHHYLAEAFLDDIRPLIERWHAVEAAAGENKTSSPDKCLGALAGHWFAALDHHARWCEEAATLSRQQQRESLQESHQKLHAPLFEALGYTLKAQIVELQVGMPVPVWAACGEAHLTPPLLIVPAYSPGGENDDPLEQPSIVVHDGRETFPSCEKQTWLEIVSVALFGGKPPPRFVILVGFKEWLLLDRDKWPNNRLLRFDWSEILRRQESITLQAAAALLHRDSLLPKHGACRLDSLDESADRHAFDMSANLKYALREAIERLGNEAAQQLRQKLPAGKQGKETVDAGELGLECLRLVYRLLCLFYIEARPELRYLPIQKSEIYAKSYSLESLRDLERTPLDTATAGDGLLFDATLRRMFSLVAQGCGAASQQSLGVGSTKEVFALAPLDSKLFDLAATPRLNQVRFPNHVWQRVIRLLSLSGGQQGGRRIHYRLLSIHRLGAVCAALLAYRGFLAPEDLYAVQPETSSGSPDPMDCAWLIPVNRIESYKPGERVHDTDEHGRQHLRIYPKDSFIYRLAGSEWQKSAHNDNTQALTRCLVKYALKELLKGKTADDILTLTVVEPAMGSAVFLNEAVNQLAEAYLEKKQAELKRRIPHGQYIVERQKTRMYIAERNVYGVDLNPVAIELAEVNLWLNAIYGEPGASGQPPKAARVPWFGFQLLAGNSLIGARCAVFSADRLGKHQESEAAWYDSAPRRCAFLPNEGGGREIRRPDEIYHFLLPDPGMAHYTDKVARQLYKEDFDRIKRWRTALKKPLATHEIERLQQLSETIDQLWAEHVRQVAEERARTQDPLPLWPYESLSPEVGQVRPTGVARQAASRRAQKETIRKHGLLNRDGDFATPYRRIKLAMDYWCALWFWPIGQSVDLPSREQWWLEIGALLEGKIVDLNLQPSFDFDADSRLSGGDGAGLEQREPPLFATQGDMFGSLPEGPALTPAQSELHDEFGQLRIDKLRQHFLRLRTVETIAAEHRFMHWELTFADIFAQRGGFDLVLGNPPWLKAGWNEAGILGEANPLAAIRKLNASELALQRSTAFAEFPALQNEWMARLEACEATQNYLGARQNYPLLKGGPIPLYKCFIPLGWSLAGPRGVVAYLHPEDPYEDPKGGALREAIYARLRAHFQCVNVRKLFVEAPPWATYSINIYASEQPEANFYSMANLCDPMTINRSSEHDESGIAGCVKDEQGRWKINGHADRREALQTKTLPAFNHLGECVRPAKRTLGGDNCKVNGSIDPVQQDLF